MLNVAKSNQSPAAFLPTDILDAVRGLASTYVMLGHARWLLLISAASVVALHLQGLVRAEILIAALTRYGHAAVMAFFVVSGYAIHYRQAGCLAKKELKVIQWKTYIFHRIRRLYPPLILALLITLVLDRLGAAINPNFYAGTLPASLDLKDASAGPHSIQAFSGTLFFTQGFATPIFGTDGPLWSLAYEGFFYVTYPIVLYGTRQLGPLRNLLLFTVLGTISLAALTWGINIGIFVMFAYWPIWVAGSFLADVRFGRLQVPDRFLRIGSTFGLILLFFLAATGQRNPYVDDIWSLGFLGVITFLVIVRHEQVVLQRLLKLARPLQKIGAMSYSLYVIHFPVLAVISATWLARNSQLPTTPWLFFLGVIIVFCMAFAAYWIGERPFLTRSRRIRMVADAAPVPVAESPRQALE